MNHLIRLEIGKVTLENCKELIMPMKRNVQKAKIITKGGGFNAYASENAFYERHTVNVREKVKKGTKKLTPFWVTHIHSHKYGNAKDAIETCITTPVVNVIFLLFNPKVEGLTASTLIFIAFPNSSKVRQFYQKIFCHNNNNPGCNLSSNVSKQLLILYTSQFWRFFCLTVFLYYFFVCPLNAIFCCKFAWDINVYAPPCLKIMLYYASIFGYCFWHSLFIEYQGVVNF